MPTECGFACLPCSNRTPKMNEIEEEFKKKDYDTLIGYIQTNIDTVMEIAFSTLFVTLLPAAPVLGFLSNVFGTRTLAWRLLHVYRRPMPLREINTKIWQVIYTTITVITIVTNAALVTFTLETFDDIFSPTVRILIFIAFHWSLIIVLYIMMTSGRNEVREVRIQRKRAQFITSKLIDKVADKIVDPLDML